MVDRIKRSAVYNSKTHDGERSRKEATLDDEAEDKIFATAESAFWIINENSHYMLDCNPVSIKLYFADDTVCTLNGNVLGYHPYDRVFEMAAELFPEIT
jgi:hypothetical protein